MSLNLMVQTLGTVFIIAMGLNTSLNLTVALFQQMKQLAAQVSPEGRPGVMLTGTLMAACMLLLVLSGAGALVLLLFYPNFKFGGGL